MWHPCNWLLNFVYYYLARFYFKNKSNRIADFQIILELVYIKFKKRKKITTKIKKLNYLIAFCLLGNSVDILSLLFIIIFVYLLLLIYNMPCLIVFSSVLLYKLCASQTCYFSIFFVSIIYLLNNFCGLLYKFH